MDNERKLTALCRALVSTIKEKKGRREHSINDADGNVHAIKIYRGCYIRSVYLSSVDSDDIYGDEVYCSCAGAEFYYANEGGGYYGGGYGKDEYVKSNYDDGLILKILDQAVCEVR
ncbi:MAG: hypothetical protein FWE82_08660 [Defluviitaleaceae bacterium]|nr:hypothetical protein [Defluviitaleaceae bacterium]